ncbi:HAD family hydrolase [Streptomyces sp. NPDC085524]|uniref:HAD family hydrolase n=1 Tax=unclassified Streptomyces TaxID=2593676 RepID=UPI0035DC87FB
MSISVVFFDCWDTLLQDSVELSEEIDARIADLLSAALGVERGFVERAVRGEGEEFSAAIRDGRTVVTPATRIGSVLDALAASGAVAAVPERAGELTARTLAAVDDAIRQVPPQVVPGARELLRELRSAGVLMCVVSNTGWTSTEAVTRALDRQGLLAYFSACYFSGDGYRPKPSPEMFVRALHDLGLDPPRALHFGDQARTDAAAALAAGLRGVVLLEGGSRYGARQGAGPGEDRRIIRVGSLDAGRELVLGLIGRPG